MKYLLGLFAISLTAGLSFQTTLLESNISTLDDPPRSLIDLLGEQNAPPPESKFTGDEDEFTPADELHQFPRGGNDCNGNGVPDDQDIDDGTSEDCNENGVPDECDLAAQSLVTIDAGDQWQYTFSDPGPDWMQPEYDDSSWDTGNAPFGTDTSGDFAYQTYWPPNTDPWLRKTIDLPLLTSVTAYIGVDNGFDLYVNGTHVFSANAEGGTWRWEYTFSIPITLFHPGANVIAIRLEDHGGATAFDMMMQVDAIPLSTDCNQNGVPDECDIADEYSEDADGDGVPDECQFAIDDAVSRLFTVFVGIVDDLFSVDAVAREFTIFVGEIGSAIPTDAIAREWSVFVSDVGPVLSADGVSREYSVFVGDIGPSSSADTISREFSVFTGDVGDVEVDGAISREFTVYIGLEVAPPVTDAISREFSVYVGEDVAPQVTDAIGREFSVFVYPPDLVVDWVSAEPDEVLAGQQISVSWAVQNVGDSTATGSWVDRVVLSTDAFLGDDTILAEFERPQELAPDGTYTNQQTVTIPPDVTGDYFIAVIADATNLIDEYDHENNNDGYTASVVHVTAPNLTIVDIELPETGLTDEPVTVRWTGSNEGNGVVLGTWHDRVYISRDEQLDPNDTAIEPDYSIDGPLEPSAQYPGDLSFAAPHEPGEYWVIVEADVLGEVTEPASGAEDNILVDDRSIVVQQAPRPNLYVASITPPVGELQEGEPVELLWTIANSGNATATGAWSESIAIVGLSGSEQLYEFEDMAIEPGGQVERVQTYQVPVPPEPGDYELTVCADTQAEVIELDDSDNCLTVSVCVGCEHPDLEGSGVETDPAVVAGEIFHASWTVVNAGDDIAEGVWWDQVHLVPVDGSAPIAVGNTVRIEGPLDPNQPYSAETDVVVPIELVGEFRPAIKIDVYNSIQEPGGESNNFYEGTGLVTVTQPDLPDLQVQAFSPPQPPEGSSWYEGDSITITWVVENEGEISAEGSWIDRLYISDDSTFEPDVDTVVDIVAIQGPLSADPNEGLYEASLDITLPDEAGTYWFAVLTDANNEVEEGADNHNNSRVSESAVVVGATPRADLHVISVTGDLNAVAGTDVTVEWTVVNQGGAIAEGYWRDRVYLSRDRECDDQDVFLGQFAHWGPEAPLAEYDVSETITLPFDVVGEYYYVVVTDASDHINEGDHEDNNCGADEEIATVTQPELPDFDITSIEFSTAPVESGSSLLITWDVTNIGELSVPEGASWIDKVSLATSPNPQPGEYIALLNSEVSIDESMLVDQGYTGELEIELPPIPRNYWVVVEVNRTNTVEEGVDLENNTMVSETYITMIWPPRPDLVVSWIELPNPAPVNSWIEIRWAVRNQGDAVATGTWNEMIYASPDDSIGGDIERRTVLVTDNMIEPGEEVIRTREIQVPDLPGGYHVVVCTDTGEVVNETNENNNCDISDVLTEVLLPDFVVSNVAAPTEAEADEVASVTWTVLNEGAAPAFGSWLDTVYLTTDGEPTEEDALGSLVRVGPLPSTSSYTVSLDVTIPGRIQGEYEFCVISDSLDVLDESGDAESNEGCAPDSTTITQPLRANLVVTQIEPLTDGLVGQPAEVQYTIVNTGDVPATGAWTDQVVAVSTTDGTEVVLSDFFRYGPFEPNDPQIYVESVRYPTRADDYQLCVVTDRTDLVNEGLAGGEDDNEKCTEDSFITDDYDITCTAEKDVICTGEDLPGVIKLSGQATNSRTREVLPNAPVALQISVRDTFRTITRHATGEKILTDDNGEYCYVFTPLPGEAGQYSVIADPPENIGDVVDDTFDIYGMHAVPKSRDLVVFPSEELLSDSYTEITLVNSGDLSLSGIELSITGVPAGLEVDAWLSDTALAELGLPGDRLTIDYRLYTEEGDFPTSIVSLVLTCNEGATATARLRVRPRPLPVTLRAIPSSLSAAMFVPDPNDPNDAEQQTHVECAIKNIGSGTAQGVEVRMPNAEWLSLTTPGAMPSLAPDETTTVVLTLQPSEGMVLGDYIGTFVVVDTTPDSNAHTVVPFNFTASSSASGILEVIPEDEGSYWDVNGNYLDGNGEKVRDAVVTLRDPQTNEVVISGITDELGSVVFSDLPEDYYNIEVQAPGHNSYQGLLNVQGGETQELNPFLPIQAVTYTWTVELIEWLDEYVFTLVTEFETDVPAPVLEIDPPSVDLTALEQEVTQVDFTITNHGLIRADDLHLSFDGNAQYQLEPLIEDLGDLDPGQSYTIPVIITDHEFGRRNDYSDPCGVTGELKCSIVCGIPIYYMFYVYFVFPDADCSGDDDGDDDDPGEDDSDDGTVEDPHDPPPPGYSQNQCIEGGSYNDNEPPGCNPYLMCCVPSTPAGSSNPGQGAGPSDEMSHPIYLFSGEFYLEEEDLRIRGRGLDFAWGRKYRSKIGPNTAQGNGWDYGYNIYLEWEAPDNPTNENLILHDGNTRNDIFAPEPGGIWGRDEFFYIIRQNDDDSFSAVFPNKSRWDFNPLDESTTGGKLSAIVDQHGNQLTLEYDEQGRLWQIRDTLNIEGEDNRVITVGYNDDGYIASVTDFIGRSITYDYYRNGDEGGSAGDLKSVTYPAVVDTPTENDFPNGKTISYTYTTGMNDERLNHNLLTITDGRRNDPNDPTYGQGPYLINEYSQTVNHEDRNYDRAIAQIWGDPDDRTDIVYEPQIPTELNRQTVMTTILNNRLGHVIEYDFDENNRLIARRVFTGQADPDQPTSSQTNRPDNPLREFDPPYFEEVYQYNGDSIRDLDVMPSGSVVIREYESHLNQNASRRSRHNLRTLIRRNANHQVPGDQEEIVERFEYDENNGGCCGTNGVTRHDDGRGTITRHVYDDFGNRLQTIHAEGTDVEAVENWEYNEFGQTTAHIHPANDTGHRRRDEYVYYTEADGHQNGFLHQEIIDAGGLNLTTSYEYDPAGNVVRMIDPRGNDTQYVVNELDQVVREISRETEVFGNDGGVVGSVRYEKDTHYDANNNVMRVDVQNIDDTGTLVATNPYITTTFEYETLNNPIRQTAEVSEGHEAVTEYEYDSHRNRTFARYGEATNGNQPCNTVRSEYDERGLLYRETRGGYDDPNSPSDPNTIPSTTQYNYDWNGNLVTRIEGIEDDEPHAHRYIYDGYGRRKLTIDPMGNVTRYTYDANGNVVNELVEGELIDEAGGWGCDVLELIAGIPPELCDLEDPSNVRLSEVAYVYDARNRLKRTEVLFFDTETQSPIDDGLAVTETFYTPNSLVWKVVDDRGNETQTAYDTANRRQAAADAKGNTVTYGYNENSNVINITEVDKSDLGNPDQQFTTTFAYDALNRQVSVTDNVDSVNRTYYDSRGNRVKTVDALDHEVRYIYDGLNRLLRTIRDMNDDGADPQATPGDTGPDIVTAQTWDDSSRLTGQTDDNGNTTRYEYDPVGRKSATIFADGTEQRVLEFDSHGNVIGTVDGNENIVLHTYDALDRLIRKDIAVGPGVSDDTTFEVFKYDGLSRLIWAEDDDTKVTRKHDSLSHVTQEVQELYDDPNTPWPPATVTTVYDSVGNQTELHYPSGRIVTTTYDELNRKKVISDAATDPNNPELIAEYWYVGPSRVERRDYGNGTRTEYTYDGVTGVPNPENDFGVKHIVRTNHFRINDGETIDDRTYTWDRMGNKTQRKDIRADGPQLEHDYIYDPVYRLIQSDKSDPNGLIESIQYILDGVGNRLEVIGGPDAGEYIMDDTQPEPADKQVNQYTTVNEDRIIYDYNGNRREEIIGGGHMQDVRYNAVNRPSILAVPTGGMLRYAYDALGRRIKCTHTESSRRTVWLNWTELEDHEYASNVTALVYGNRIDAPIMIHDAPDFYYYHADDMDNTTCITSVATSDVHERYEYLDFGKPIIMDAAGIPQSHSTLSSLFLFTGRRYESHAGWYYLRTRDMDPKSGRFMTRDALGTWWDNAAIGNALSYATNNSWSRRDPFGTASENGSTICTQMPDGRCKAKPNCRSDHPFKDCCEAHEYCHIEAHPEFCRSHAVGSKNCCPEKGDLLMLHKSTQAEEECTCYKVGFSCIWNNYYKPNGYTLTQPQKDSLCGQYCNARKVFKCANFQSWVRSLCQDEYGCN